MPIPEYVRSNLKESAYLSRVKQQYLDISQNIANAKSRPPKPTKEPLSGLIFMGIVITFIPSCTISVFTSEGGFLQFLISLVVFSTFLSFVFAVCIKESSNKEYSEWTPQIGEKRAKTIAIKNNFEEKQYLLSIFDHINKLDHELERTITPGEIISTKNKINIFRRKVFTVYQEILREEKLKSVKRYSKSVTYNRILDGNYSTSDHFRAKKRIQAQEQSRLEGFVIALAHIYRSLIWADELLSEL